MASGLLTRHGQRRCAQSTVHCDRVASLLECAIDIALLDTLLFGLLTRPQPLF